MDRPDGRPDAAKVTALPPVVSWGAVIVSAEMAEPDTWVWVPGLVTERLSTFQVSVIDPAVPVAEVPPPAEPVANVAPEA